MVARGDLGMEIPPERVFQEQKTMIEKCREVGKPCVVATQMLESMINNPRPTRAECSDVANAVLDGADAVMLSGETANGKFPKDAVAIMARTCMEAEATVVENDPSGYDEILKYMKASKEKALEEGMETISQAASAASTAVKMACDIGAKAIVVLSTSGETARYIAKFHPHAKIIAICENSTVARQIEGYLCNAVAVVSTIKRSPTNKGDGSHVRLAFEKGKEFGIFKTGDLIPVVHTMRNEDNEARSWTIRITSVLTSHGPYDEPVGPPGAAALPAALPTALPTAPPAPPSTTAASASAAPAPEAPAKRSSIAKRCPVS